MLSKRFWSFAALPSTLALLLFFLWNYGVPEFGHTTPAQVIDTTPPPPSPPPTERPSGPIYKDISKTTNPPANPISDNFALAEGFLSKDDFPAIPSWNRPPSPHVPEKTPLFIGFTRNWPLLQQCILSYITAGWPPSDIYVVDNTGTMKSNFPRPGSKRGQLTLQNPFYLNVDRLINFLGVNVIATPTLLTFAQLQNFYIYTALENNWDYYFWGHMDVLVLSDEDLTLGQGEHPPAAEFKSFYMRAVDAIRESTAPGYATTHNGDWAIRFFAYDWLALNNVKSFVKLGGWDTFVSFYLGDCDMHERISMAGMKMATAEAGWVFDIGTSISLPLLFRRSFDPEKPPKTLAELKALPEDVRGEQGFRELRKVIDVETEFKAHGDAYRNAWQVKQAGGQNEPFYRDPRGFAEAMEMAIANGVATYKEKWGHEGCDLRKAGLKLADAWKVEKDFEIEKKPECDVQQ